MQFSGVAKSSYVRAMFAAIVPRYDLMNTLMTFGLDRAWRRQVAAIVSGPSRSRALDVAAGTGALTRELARAGFVDPVGLDFCQEMVVAAARRPARPGKRVWPVVGDGLALPFADDSFDAVTSGFALRNFADLPAAFAEMARVTRPNGIVAALELTHPTFAPVRWLFALYFGRIVPLLGWLVTGRYEAYAYLPESLARHPSPPAIARMLRDAGLEPCPHRRLGLGTIAIHLATKRGTK